MIRVTTDVFCDMCGSWEHGLVRFSADSKAARRVVHAKGWVFYRGKDLCPHCKTKAHEQKED